jgi:hypothetical protein
LGRQRCEPRRNEFDLSGGEELSSTGGARKGAGRKKGKRTSDRIQITLRVNPETAAKLRAEAKQRLEEERRFRPERKRPNIGKVLDELAKHL